MSFLSFYVSPKGRATRFDYWVKGALVLGVVSVGVSLISAALFSEETGTIVDGVVQLILIWPSTIVAIKRCHDRDKSGWFVLLFTVVPVIGWLWGIVELGFLKGSPGMNRFGPSAELRQMEEALGAADAPVHASAASEGGTANAPIGAMAWEDRRAYKERTLWPDGSPRFGRRGL